MTTSPCIEQIDRLTTGWALSHMYQSQSDFVSQLKGFAVLAPDQTPLAIGGKLTPADLAALLGQADNKAALAQSVGDGAVVAASLPGDSHLRLAFVPAMDHGKVARVYAFVVDQTAAAALTNLALTVVTLTTSLLIVMGFSVPAAIASRRIRERWLAEDQIRYPRHARFAHRPAQSCFSCASISIAPSLAPSRHGHLMAVFCLDLDRFKDVNDTLGHPTGDALLADRSRRDCRQMRARSRPRWPPGRRRVRDRLPRISKQPAGRHAARALDSSAPRSRETYQVNGHEVSIRASIGIAIGPLDGDERRETLTRERRPRALSRQASDGAQHLPLLRAGAWTRAAEAARGWSTICVSALRNELALARLPAAVRPRRAAALTGYEALVRWWHPSRRPDLAERPSSRSRRRPA